MAVTMVDNSEVMMVVRLDCHLALQKVASMAAQTAACWVDYSVGRKDLLMV